MVKFATDVTAIEAAGTRSSKGAVRAINRAQAVIEFELDGTIITANENFLDDLRNSSSPRSPASIIGSSASPHYVEEPRSTAEFWQQLGRGRVRHCGEFKRVGQGMARQIWLQASYNPILDARMAKPLKVVKFASDVTAAKLQQGRVRGEGPGDQIGRRP